MKKPTLQTSLLRAAFVALAFTTACASSTAATEEAKLTYTKETLPEPCKNLVEGLKSCEAVAADAPTASKVCAQSVTNREGPNCPVSLDEAKRTLAN